MTDFVPSFRTLAASVGFLALAGWTGAVSGAGPAQAEGNAESKPVEAHSHAGAYLAGWFAEKQSDFSTAAYLLDRLLEDSPDDPELKVRAFYANLRAGLFDRALDLAKSISEQDVNVPMMAQFTVVAGSLRDGAWEEALAMAEQVPDNSLARYAKPMVKAWALAGLDRTDDAIAALGELTDETGFRRLRSLHEGMIFVRAGRLDDALAALVEEGEDVATAPLRKVRTVAKLYALQGRTQDAEDLLRNYLDRFPGTVIVEQDLSALADGKRIDQEIGPAEGVSDGFYHLASGVQQQSEEFALVFGRLSSMLDPSHDLPLLLVGNILEDRDRFSDAVATLDKIQPDSPYYWDARLSIADNYVDQGKKTQAVDLLEGMAEERPDSTDPLIKIGYVLRADKRYLDEVEIYNRAISRIDGDPEARHWILFYNRGIAYERSKQWAKAEPDFLKALDLKPDDPFVLNYLGYSWVEQGVNIPEAKEMIRKALDQRQTDGYIVDSLGWVLYRTGSFDEAVGYLERAVQLRPQDPIINDHLGDAYWRVGRRNEARFQWDRALNLEPEEDVIPTIREKLKNGMGEPEIIEISN
ncbi:tetratricopeptide repeat protein [Hwanghaeella sp.]|uniref:tetratricopeptide repeat protein n=1 Tax=Hwanghaeella sp. TaxID=2605943 RepID=UPI003CCBE429